MNVFIYQLHVAKVLDCRLCDRPMITPRQIRAARAILGWTQQDLADKAGVHANAVARLERGDSDARSSTVIAVQNALIKGGVELIAADERKGEGVRMAKPDR